MSRVAVVTDSASDLTPEQAAAAGITVVPLLVNFGDKEYRAGVDITAEGFWEELTAQRAISQDGGSCAGHVPRDVRGLFADGADEIVYVGVGVEAVGHRPERDSRARHAERPRDPHRRQRVGESMGVGLLALEAAEMASQGSSAEDIATSSSGGASSCGCTSCSRRSSTSSAAGGSARPGRPSAVCSRSSRSSPSRRRRRHGRPAAHAQQGAGAPARAARRDQARACGRAPRPGARRRGFRHRAGRRRPASRARR
jgi:hypothetical protein